MHRHVQGRPAGDSTSIYTTLVTKRQSQVSLRFFKKIIANVLVTEFTLNSYIKDVVEKFKYEFN